MARHWMLVAYLLSLPLQAEDALLQQARAASAQYAAQLPNFLVTQRTSRYQGSLGAWVFKDVVGVEVRSENGQEQYFDIRLNGTPVGSSMAQTGGTWSTGEFAGLLEDLFAPETAATFAARRSCEWKGGVAACFDLAVTQQRSRWRVSGADNKWFEPAYSGTLWVDPATRRVVRIEIAADSFPRGFPLSRVRQSLEYGPVTIEGRPYLLPVSGETIACAGRTSRCARNVIDFEDYRKFEADSKISFGNVILR